MSFVSWRSSKTVFMIFYENPTDSFFHMSFFHTCACSPLSVQQLPYETSPLMPHSSCSTTRTTQMFSFPWIGFLTWSLGSCAGQPELEPWVLRYIHTHLIREFKSEHPGALITCDRKELGRMSRLECWKVALYKTCVCKIIATSSFKSAHSRNLFSVLIMYFPFFLCLLSCH